MKKYFICNRNSKIFQHLINLAKYPTEYYNPGLRPCSSHYSCCALIFYASGETCSLTSTQKDRFLRKFFIIRDYHTLLPIERNVGDSLESVKTYAVFWEIAKIDMEVMFLSFLKQSFKRILTKL